MPIESYGKPRQCTDRFVAEMLATEPELTYQEKVDGSQISFGRDVETGELMVRSKGRNLNLEAVPDLFKAAVEAIKEAPLVDGYVYRGECLKGPQHNVLHYERAPRGHVVLFDVQTPDGFYVAQHSVKLAAGLLGFDYAPVLHVGPFDKAKVDELLETTSVLGGQRIEGIVLKGPPNKYLDPARNDKPLMAKYVLDAFREMHGRAGNVNGAPTKGSIIAQIAKTVCTEARWRKAVQRRSENGELQRAPKDIGPLLADLKHDILEETTDDIKTMLFNEYKKHVLRVATNGFPQWYREKLTEGDFV